MLFLLFVKRGKVITIKYNEKYKNKMMSGSWGRNIIVERHNPSQILRTTCISASYKYNKSKSFTFLPAVNSLFVRIPDVIAFLLESRAEEHHFSLVSCTKWYQNMPYNISYWKQPITFQQSYKWRNFPNQKIHVRYNTLQPSTFVYN